MVAADNTPSLQSFRSMPDYAHIASLVFQRSHRVEFFECLHEDVESSTSNGEAMPIENLCSSLEDHLTAISTIWNGFKDDWVYSRLCVVFHSCALHCGGQVVQKLLARGEWISRIKFRDCPDRFNRVQHPLSPRPQG